MHGLIQVSSFLVPSCAPEPRARGRIGHGEANVAKSIHRAFRAFEALKALQIEGKIFVRFLDSELSDTRNSEKLLSFLSPSEFPVRFQIYSIKNFRILRK